METAPASRSAESRRSLRLGALAAGAILLVGAAVWFVVAVVLPLGHGAACAGIEFHAPVETSSPARTPRVPAIGGEEGFAGRVRAALRSPGAAVYCGDFADPFVLRAGREYFAYSTNSGARHVAVLSASELFGTGRHSEALPELPRWSKPGRVWAPSVLTRRDRYVLYYTTRVARDGRQCLSRAVSSTPAGPFVDRSAAPLSCPPHGGAIDPEPFVDRDGTAYLLWKEYGDTVGIVGQRLSADGLRLVGARRLLLPADQLWEAGIVEAPSMARHGARYYLFYSATTGRPRGTRSATRCARHRWDRAPSRSTGRGTRRRDAPAAPAGRRSSKTGTAAGGSPCTRGSRARSAIPTAPATSSSSRCGSTTAGRSPDALPDHPSGGSFLRARASIACVVRRTFLVGAPIGG